MKPILVLGFLVLTAGLAGCIGDEDAPAEQAEADATKASAGAHRTPGFDAVIAFNDNGINPYHEAFRTNTSRADQHPSTYLPTYPETAQPLNLTFDHENLTAAVGSDCEEWAKLEPGQLYYVPGTRVVGLMNPVEDDEGFAESYGFDWTCEGAGDAWPPFLRNGEHGTEVASRAAGGEHGACEDCLIVSTLGCCGFENGRAQQPILWDADQSWIDVQSNSWEPGAPCPPALVENANCRGPGSEFLGALEDAASRQPVFWASGNGFFGGEFDYVGHPAQADPKNTPSVIRVGGHDNGHIILWPGSGPNIVSDACWSWAAEHDTLDERTPRTGSGTSAAAPYAAGIAAQIIQDAREALNDDRTGIRDGVLASGNASSIEEGLLADGELTKGELERVLYTTANPRPEETEDDGEFGCEFAGERRRGVWALPLVAWSDVPEGPAGIPLIGYGAVTQTTAEHATQVLSGEEEMPERAAEDAYFEVDRTQRETAYEAYTGTGGDTVEVAS